MSETKNAPGIHNATTDFTRSQRRAFQDIFKCQSHYGQTQTRFFRKDVDGEAQIVIAIPTGEIIPHDEQKFQIVETKAFRVGKRGRIVEINMAMAKSWIEIHGE